MSFEINNNVKWDGKNDWELRRFHGDEYSTYKGLSYNSYLVRDEKTVLIDTVWNPFSKEFVDNLKKEIDLKEIDYIIANHGEVDHSGAFLELMREIPDTPIYCTENGVKSLKGQYHKDWNFKTVKTGDKLNIGERDLIAIEAPMLHWPDTMMTYMTVDNILFSNDAFGMHYASEKMYNDLVDQDELYSEAVKYYANILTPFSKMVTNKIKEVLSLEVPVDMICPSHGIIWRDNPTQIVEKYLEWADDYQENQITVMYDSMWENTKKMAEAIVEGIKEADSEVMVKVYNISKTDKNDIITEVFKSKAILVGSSTINGGILSGVAGILEEIKGLLFMNKKAASFGSYGWAPKSVKIMNKTLEDSKFELINEGLTINWTPDEEGIKKSIEFGKEAAEAAK